MDSTVEHQPAQHRFLLKQDGAEGVLVYRLDVGVMTISHTGVDPRLGGRRVGSALVEAALDWARTHRLKVAPTCPFAAAYMQRHPETRDLLA